ncbi:MAG: metallophosphoesterase family protein [Pirellulaceae bacterium]|nr:metallophosphoesterase family protein [Pirellulaceae bacterium]
MKLGLLADIHEQVDALREALDALRRLAVDQIVVLGDLVASGERMEETCRLLSEAGAIGVWGNHDFGLAWQPSDELRGHYSPLVMRYMTSLRARLEVGDCLVTHVEPWLNPYDVMDLWYFEGPPDTPEKIARIFAASPARILLGGHYHQWLAATPAGILPWDGSQPLRMTPGQRYFVVVHAVLHGYYAVLDTRSRELFPYRLVLPCEEPPDFA